MLMMAVAVDGRIPSTIVSPASLMPVISPVA